MWAFLPVFFSALDPAGVFGDPVARPCLVVPEGASVTFDRDDPAYFDVLRVEGVLELADGASRTIEANQIVVAGHGRLEVGTPDDRFTSDAELRLTGAEDVGACETVYEVSDSGSLVESERTFEELHQGCMGMPELDRTLRVQEGAQLVLHGDDRRVPWVRVVEAVEEDDEAFVVQGPTGWQVGDEVRITGTDFLGEASDVVLASVEVDAATGVETWAVTHPEALATHYVGTAGAPEAANRTRNIRILTPHPAASPLAPDCRDGGFTTEEVELDGAEVRVESCGGHDHPPLIQVEDVAIEDGGKFDRMGRYPMHLHMVGDLTGTYLRRLAISRSSNRGVVVHGSSFVEVTDNVVLDAVGHGFYLEESDHHETAYNTLRGNLAHGILGCPSLADDDTNDQVALDHDQHASGFFFTDPRNVLAGNVAAGVADVEHSASWVCEGSCDGSAPAGAGFWYAGGNERNGFNLCGDAGLDYAVALTQPLDPDLFPDTSAYDDTLYDGQTCHGAFAGNSAHGVPNGFWAGEHKEQVVRVTDFTAWKVARRAVDVKNHGITEVVRLQAADSGTAVWPASHAYHLGKSPRFLLVDASIVGESANTGFPRPGEARSYPPRGECFHSSCENEPVYGVEVYEGHVHLARTHFEGFAPAAGMRAALGRHQRFPFYTNDPHNSVEALSFGPATQRLYFDPPEPGAQGFAMVMLRDLDGSVFGDPGAWLVADSPFVVPDTGAVFDAVANAWRVDGAVHHYGQLVVQWCARSRCRARVTGAGVPASEWQLDGDVMDLVDGLRVTDEDEGDELFASHSVNGVHNALGTNLVLERDYRVDLLDTSGDPLGRRDLEALEAIQVHLRSGAPGGRIDLQVPVPDEPTCVAVFDGTDDWTEGDWDDEGDAVRIRPTLGPGGEEQAILLLFGPRCPR